MYSQPNQLAHMEQGGCLYREPSPFVEEEVWETDSDSDASEAEDDARNSFIARIAAEIQAEQAVGLEEGAKRLLEMDFGEDDDDSSEFSPEEEQEEVPEVKKDAEVKDPEPEREPLFEAPIPLGECPICYEELKMIDFTVTKCGHTFHSSCVFKALEQNLDCPMCRCQLLEVQEEEEEDEDQEDEDEDQEGEEDEESVDEGAPENQITMEQLATKLQNMGYTPVDFLTLFMGNLLKREDETRQTEEFLDTLNEKIDDLACGRITLAHRDQRSYAQVVAPEPQPQPQQVVRLKDLERIVRPQPEQQQQAVV
jgi:hypothetical protein